MTDFKYKLQNLKSRRLDRLTKAFSLSESFNRNHYGDNTTYALEAMEPIDETYTLNTYKACDKVQHQLTNGLSAYGIGVDFRYQGSVPTNTHIRLYSDIDLLTLHRKFYTLGSPQIPRVPYEGDPLADLKDLREKSFRILGDAYPACDVDNTGSKCITISGGSLDRKIDVIAGNWHDSMRYALDPVETNRGIEILDRDRNERILNFPFLHIHVINQKDERVDGNEKRMIRLLKSIKVDADQSITVSSYDIASLVYNMPDAGLIVGRYERLKLLDNTNAFLKRIIEDQRFRDTLNVANGTRKIFCVNGARVEEVLKLQQELNHLILSITGEIKPLFESLEKANVIY